FIPYVSLSSFFHCSRPLFVLHSFPTRRSSDLFRFSRRCFGPAQMLVHRRFDSAERKLGARGRPAPRRFSPRQEIRPRFSPGPRQDRKSTRLNSSHRTISYAVFCLKKKNT